MLKGLFIQNLAVIERISVDFSSGFLVFTGETGAGKSIVIDAIHAVLGGRCSKELVRTGADKAVIIGSFADLPDSVIELAGQNGIELNREELVIQREITAEGKTTARIDGRPVTVGMLRDLGRHLIHIHGQHDNQLLLAAEQHRLLLDRFGGLGSLLEEYQRVYRRLGETDAAIQRLSLDEAEKNRRIDLLGYQIAEIEQARLEPGEEERLEQESNAIRHAERIAQNLSRAYYALAGSEDESGGADQLLQASQALEVVQQFMPSLSELADRLREIGYESQELQRQISDCLRESQFDPNRLNTIESRLDEIYKLKRKYGSTIEEILAFLQTSQAELEQIELADERLQQLEAERETLVSQCQALAKRLSQARQSAAKRFVQRVAGELQFLDMQGVCLSVDCQTVTLGPFGQDQLEFLISTNVGEPPKPIAKIASGGELSRIMLAIQNTLAEKDEIPTLIFDEVDTGVSGSAAQKIGLKLKQASRHRQVLSVTHLAQIAALADCHYQIRKTVKQNRTYTEVVLLDLPGRVEEVARIMSTGTITDLMRQNARDMIEQAE